MSDVSVCPKCGTPLPASGGLAGLCARCVALVALPLEEPDPAGQEAARGETTARVSLRRIGEYELLEEIGRGGMGVVFRARQVSLDRIVAVKMVLAGQFAGAGFLQRLRAEALAAARLRHPNIVPVHEVGEHDGQPFFSMELVEGRSLADLVRDQPLPARQAATYLKTIAEAIHYAHEQGIVHRDLKPSNILVDHLDAPRVTDFGLAKRLTEDPGSDSPQASSILHPDRDLTLTGQTLGTPNYMPPEQVSARRGEASPVGDIYSLGAILYHLLTGRPLFLAASVESALHQLLHAEPVAPRLLNPGIPRDLETICLKCLNKDPKSRYLTARALAEDLGHWLRGESILARPASAPEKLWRWCRRNPVLAGATVAISVCLATLAVVTLRAAARVERARDEARRSETNATTRLRGSLLAQAQAVRMSSQPGRREQSLALLAQAAALDPPADFRARLRDEVIATLAVPQFKLQKSWKNFDPSQTKVTFDRDLEHYAAGTETGEIIVRRVADDVVVQTLPPVQAPVMGVWSFSPSGRMLAAFYGDGQVRVWDLREKKMLLQTPGLLWGESLAFHPQELEIAVMHSRNGALRFRLPSGELIHSNALPFTATCCCYDPAGRRLALTSTSDPRALVLRLDSDLLTVLRHPHAAGLGEPAWHPSEDLLAVANHDALIYLWNPSTQEQLRVLSGHQAEVGNVSFNRRGDRLVSSSWDGTILWNHRTGERLAWTEAYGAGHHFSEDDERLGMQTWLRPGLILFEAVGSPVSRVLPLRESRGATTATTFHPSGRILACAQGVYTLLLDARTGEELAVLRTGPVVGLFFDRDGGNLFTSGASGLLRWPCRLAPETARTTIGPPAMVNDRRPWSEAAMSPDGRFFAAFHGDHLHLFSTTDLREISHTIDQQAPGDRFLSFSPDGAWLATSSWHGHAVWVWKTATGELLKELADEDWADAACMPQFSADGRWLIIGAKNSLECWDARTWKRVRRFALADTGPYLAAWPGQVMAARGPSYGATLFVPETLRPLAILSPPELAHVDNLCFSRDGATLMMSRRLVQELLVWDLGAIGKQVAALGLDWDLPSLPTVTSVAGWESARPFTVLDGGKSIQLIVPPRPQEAGPEQLDLSAFYNRPLNWEGRSRSGNNLAALKPGLHRLGNVSFDIRGVIQLRGTTTTEPELPETVERVSVGRKCARLHFLHGTTWLVKDGIPIGSYRVRYRDGRIVELPILYGEDVREWHTNSDRVRTAGRAVVVWTGSNAVFPELRLFKRTWDNPFPDAEIESLDFQSSMTPCAPFLLAITAEP